MDLTDKRHNSKV
jgi:superoxide dismutase